MVLIGNRNITFFSKNLQINNSLMLVNVDIYIILMNVDSADVI